MTKISAKVILDMKLLRLKRKQITVYHEGKLLNYKPLFVCLCSCMLDACVSVCALKRFKVVTICLFSCSRLSEGSSEEGEDDMIIDHELLEVDVADGSTGSSGSHGSSSDDERSRLAPSFSLCLHISLMIALCFILDRGHTVSTVMVKNCWALTANRLICKSQVQWLHQQRYLDARLHVRVHLRLSNIFK